MPPRPSGIVYVAGTPFKTSAPVVNFRDPPYWDATREFCIATETDPRPPCAGGVPHGNLPKPYTQRYALRPQLRQFGKMPSGPAALQAAKSVIKQFVVHHDGCTSADMCFAVLQNERGLSCHFLVDNDGTIYQTIDLALMAYHAAEWNIASIGVEFCNRGDALAFPGVYDTSKMNTNHRFGPTRGTKPCTINGHTILSYEFTKPQLDSFALLCRDLLKILPNLPAEFPQKSPGVQADTTLPAATTFNFAGYIGHYHLTNQKWDPGPFDFKKHCRDIRGSFCFPMFPKGGPTPDAPLPAIPKKTDDLKEATTELYKTNEVRGDGGFFPVGPWGDQRLWHGGVHLIGKPGDQVFAPFPGRLVAARMVGSTPIGSVNFVLLRHDMSLGASRVQFYSLYMHLANDVKDGTQPEWMTKEGSNWAKESANPLPNGVVLLDEPIEAGAVIGHVGKAGPAELSRAQIHVEFFSTAELFTGIAGSPWTVVDGTAGGRFCDNQQINENIDTDKDGTLSRQELASYYSNGNGQQLRFLVTLHVSEWTGDPPWADALRVPKDFKKMKPAEIDQLVADQITPGLWWDAKVASHCRLPSDGVVYHYNPVSFLGWFNQQLLDAEAAAGPGTVDPSKAQEVPKGITDDYGDVNGTSARSSAEITEDPCNQLTLSDIVLGFDAPGCGQ